MSTTSSIPNPSTLVKAKREKVKKIDAVSIKPPKVTPDPDGGEQHKYFCTYVSARFQQVVQPCTFDVWKRCEGKQIPGRVRDGLDARLNNDFIIIQDANNVVVDIDIIPKTYYASRAVLPDNLQNKDDIVIKVIPKSGNIEVMQCPAGITKSAIRKLLDNLDNVTSLQPGDTILGGFEILNVSGNQVSIVSTSSDS
jgi:hypothetical protein